MLHSLGACLLSGFPDADEYMKRTTKSNTACVAYTRADHGYRRGICIRKGSDKYEMLSCFRLPNMLAGWISQYRPHGGRRSEIQLC